MEGKTPDLPLLFLMRAPSEQSAHAPGFRFLTRTIGA